MSDICLRTVILMTDKKKKKKKLHAPASLASTINIAYMLAFTVCLVLFSLAVLIVLRVFIVSWAQDDINAMRSKINGIDILNKEEMEAVSVARPVYVLLFAENGEAVYEIDNLNENSGIPLMEKKYKSKFFDKRIDNNEYRIYFETKVIDNQTYYLQICRDTSRENRVYSILASIIVYSVILSIGISIVIGYRVAAYLLKPITQMTSTISEISESSITARINTKKSKSELRELGESINKTLDELEAAYNSQSYMISDISHELRTPLSVISGYSELLSRWAKDDPEVLDEAISAISLQTKAINDMISKFSFLSKAESKGIVPIFNHFNLCDLVNELIPDFSLLHSKINFLNLCHDKTILYADKALIRQLLVILLDNSCKYTPSDGKISISAITEKKLVTISVTDTGTGIPEDELDKIFTRFYRVDKSRTKATGGFGLGLAIAYQIVSVHGGEIKAQSTGSDGTSMIIKLPQPF